MGIFLAAGYLTLWMVKSTLGIMPNTNDFLIFVVCLIPDDIKLADSALTIWKYFKWHNKQVDKC